MDQANGSRIRTGFETMRFHYPLLVSFCCIEICSFCLDSLIFEHKMNSNLFKCFIFTFLLLPAAAFAGEVSDALSTPKSLNLTHHIIGYLSIVVTVLAYIAAMSEEVIELRKSKPMVLGSALVWFAICIYYALHGEAKVAAVAFESNLLAYVELFLFILVSMTYLNAMEERGIFDGLRIWLLSRQYSYRQLFWITGVLAFVLSTVISGMAVGLLMGAVAAAVGKK